MSAASSGFGIGQPLRRKEDPRLLTGRGCYSDDVSLPGQVYAAMVRSPYAHARIGSIDAREALDVPGVLAVLTGAHAAAAGLKAIPHNPAPTTGLDIELKNSDGSAQYVAPHFLLPDDKARFVGEAVAMVVATTAAVAKDAAELVEVDYEPLPAIIETAAAATKDAPLVWEEAGSNVVIDASVGDANAVDAAFAQAAHVVSFKTWIQRVTGVPMEPRSAAGDYDSGTGRYTLHAGSGGVVRQKKELAAVLGVSENAVRVVARDIGGNFGTRNAFFPEFALVVWASKQVGRPVKWTAERREALLSDFQGRDLYVEAELALDREGRFLGLRASNISNLGSHSVSHVPLIKSTELMSAVYLIPAVHVRARAVLSNTPPTNPYRSAGRPEAMFVMERLVDLAAERHGFDRVALRRLNLVPGAAMPYANGLGMTYDSGDYPKAMDDALRLADWNGFEARRKESAARGKLRGLGLANYVEATSGNPRERAKITVHPEGRVDLVIGTLSSGQGHETSFAQCLVDWLGVPFESIRHIQGDTDRVPVGGGSHSGRSMRLAGNVMGYASDALIEKGVEIAAHVLEAAAGDIEFTGGRFRVKGTDRSLGLFDAAAAARQDEKLPADLRGALAAESDQVVKSPGFPYGSHACEVEVDPETGVVDLVRYAAVDDVGRAINPLILHGQTHGGVAQGVGQALLEHCHYDLETGQMLSATLMDYGLPRADTLPSFDTELSEVPTPTNRLGVRAGGEGGTTPALGVVVNAVVHALSALGVKHIEMPLTPYRVWKAIEEARAPNTVRTKEPA